MTNLAKIDKDLHLKIKIESLKNLGDEYWSFQKSYERDYAHNYFKYPAMMVPQMVRKILNEFTHIDSNVKYIHDPFLGSGTVLTEAMLQGLEFVGRDINPLSILLSKVKYGPFNIKILNKKILILIKKIEIDNSNHIDICFNNIDKWFRKDVQIDLCKIRRAIKEESTLWVRRFFWIVLAETIRQTSNSRTSTYKLHIRTKEDIKMRIINVISVFRKVLHLNFINYSKTCIHLNEKNLLNNKGIYTKKVNLFLGDARTNLKITNKYDLIFTSPPYGDNQTTVPYGQYSYLPLSWIELSDIDKKITYECLKTLSDIDNRSLGGIKCKDIKKEEYLKKISPTYTKYYIEFQNKPKDLLNKITSFFYDLDQSINMILKNLRKDGYLIWVLGNRTVGGINISLDEILKELLHQREVQFIDIIFRPIHNKRMASKNKSSSTMTRESIAIFRKINH